MPIAAPTAGNRILASDLSAFYNLLKGVSGSGETITLIYNADSALVFQPSSDPAAGTRVISVKNNAGTVLGSITFDGKFLAADGTVTVPSFANEGDTNTGIYFSAADTVDIAAGGVRAAQFSTVASAVNYLDIAPSATGNAVTATAEGTDTNVSINLVPKGSGTVQAAGSQVLVHSLADAKGDIIVATADNTFTRLAVGSNDQVLTADSAQSTGVKWASGSQVVKEVGYAAVDTSESTTSTSFTDLTTAGPSVTMTAVLNDKMNCHMTISAYNDTASSYVYMAPKLDSDATAAADGQLARQPAGSGTHELTLAAVKQFSGLSAASHTVKVQYQVSANTGTFARRHLMVYRSS